MIENRMVIDSEWNDEEEPDYFEDNATEGAMMDCLFSEGLVHLFMEYYLDVEDLEEKEEKCEELFEAMCVKYPISFKAEFTKWMRDKEDMLRDIFNKWYKEEFGGDWE